jgi:hypothetical protein
VPKFAERDPGDSTRGIDDLAVERCYGDIFDDAALRAAMADCDVVYYPTAMSCTTASSMHGCGCAIRRRDTFDGEAQTRMVSVTDRRREHGLALIHR